MQSININGNDNSLQVVVGRSTGCDCENVNCLCDNIKNKSTSEDALLKKPIGLTVDSLGRLYIVDQVFFL